MWVQMRIYFRIFYVICIIDGTENGEWSMEHGDTQLNNGTHELLSLKLNHSKFEFELGHEHRMKKEKEKKNDSVHCLFCVIHSYFKLNWILKAHLFLNNNT